MRTFEKAKHVAGSETSISLKKRIAPHSILWYLLQGHFSDSDHGLVPETFTSALVLQHLSATEPLSNALSLIVPYVPHAFHKIPTALKTF